MIYRADVSDLISTYKNIIIEECLRNALIDFIILLLLYFLIGIFSIIVFIILLLFSFLPSPFIPAPRKYIIDKEIIYFGKTNINIKNLKIIVNIESNYISLRKKWRGEVIRLYSKEIKILESILKEKIN